MDLNAIKKRLGQLQTTNNILIRVWATNEQEKFSDFALETSEKLLDYFESYFGNLPTFVE